MRYKPKFRFVNRTAAPVERRFGVARQVQDFYFFLVKFGWNTKRLAKWEIESRAKTGFEGYPFTVNELKAMMTEAGVALEPVMTPGWFTKLFA